MGRTFAQVELVFERKVRERYVPPATDVAG
jgi:hypothetical protein